MVLPGQAQSFTGIGASPGVALGHAFVLDRRKVKTPKVQITAAGVDEELRRLKEAIELSDQQLEAVKKRLAKSQDQEHGMILEAHRMMLRDPVFLGGAQDRIRKELINAEWAVRRTVKQLQALFEDISDDFFRERRGDIDFVGDRVVRNLLGQAMDVKEEVPKDAIIVAHDLSPADAAVLLEPGKVVGFVTDVGAQTSHTAIVARAREIPGVVGTGTVSEQVQTGDLIALDGVRGLVVVHPSAAQEALFREAVRQHLQSEEALLRMRELPAVTADGARVTLLGNLEFQTEVPMLLAHGAEGIGLYRTEFLYLGRDDMPSEADHYEVYCSILKAMAPSPVTIRTIDLGGEKMPGRRVGREPNPAMGLRAIRYCLKHRDVFKVQLRALLRASVHGNLRIMFPMICSMSELREAKGALEEARQELLREGQPVSEKIPIGIMVETPSAALVADRLAKESDFFSVGTNDLIGYSLAIDRANREVAYLYRPLHLAIIRALRDVVRYAKEAKIPVSICGEMAGDPVNALVLLALGFDSLSMSAGQIPIIKRIMRAGTLADARELLDAAMNLGTAEEIERFVRREMEKRFGNLLTIA